MRSPGVCTVRKRELIQSGAVGAGEFWRDMQGSFGRATNFLTAVG